MVFVKQSIQYVLIAFFFVGLLACSSTPENTIDKKPVVVPLVKSDSYIPKQEYDLTTGKKIPYKPDANPYLRDKTVVTAEAKRAFSKADKAMKNKQYTAAEKQFAAMTEKYPQLSGPWVKLARLAEIEKSYSKALEHLSKATNVNANNVNAWLALGLLQRQQGMFTQAQNSYVSALKIWKDFPEAQLNLAIVYDLYLNQPENAQQHFEAYLFLTHYKDKKARKWLAEVKRRTKIKTSFIDKPPVIEPKPVAAVEAAATDKK